MRLFKMGALAALSLVSGLAMAEVQVEGPVEYGLFETPQREVQAGERVLLRNNQQIHATSAIPAKLGTKFGLRMTLSGKQVDDAPLTLLYLTPGVITPDGQRHDRFEVVQKLAPGSAQDVMAFEFSDPYEVVPGEWHFLVFQGDRKLAEQRFQVR